eukprot:4589492-Pleurochrysis_carterae.AAC.2
MRAPSTSHLAHKSTIEGVSGTTRLHAELIGDELCQRASPLEGLLPSWRERARPHRAREALAIAERDARIRIAQPVRRRGCEADAAVESHTQPRRAIALLRKARRALCTPATTASTHK